MLYPIQGLKFETLWDIASPYFTRAMETAPIPVSLYKLKELAQKGELKPFLIKHNGEVLGAALFQVADYFGVTVLNIFAMAHDDWYTHLEVDVMQTDTLARHLGCAFVMCYGRKGFEKTLAPMGYKHMQTVMVKEL